jgi:branched-chain amino acid transport system substrate-binding protein
MTGRLAWIGEQLQRGSEMAVADVNAAGGLLGQDLQLVTADDFCDPAQAAAAAKKLVSDGVALVIGHYCSGASIPASEIYHAGNILQMSPGSTNPLLTERGFGNVFRVIGRDDEQGKAAGTYLAEHWAGKRVGILHDNSTYGKGVADETRKEMNRRGLKESVYKAYEPGKSNYSAEAAELEVAQIAVVYVGGYHTEVALLAIAARQRGYSVQFISGDAMATEELGLIAGPAAEGILFTFVTDPRRNPQAARVVERFRAQGFEPHSYTLLTYAAVEAWSQAVKKTRSLEQVAVAKSLKTERFDTVLGRIGFNDKGDITPVTWEWYRWKGGEYAPLR